MFNDPKRGKINYLVSDVIVLPKKFNMKMSSNLEIIGGENDNGKREERILFSKREF